MLFRSPFIGFFVPKSPLKAYPQKQVSHRVQTFLLHPSVPPVSGMTERYGYWNHPDQFRMDKLHLHPSAQRPVIYILQQWLLHIPAIRSVRRYKDEDKVAQAAKDHGYTDIYRQSLITMTEMQKLMGKKNFEVILGDLIVKPKGKPTLVPVTDKQIGRASCRERV